MKNNKESQNNEQTSLGFIPIRFHRIQTIPLDNSRYNNLAEFFKSLVAKYKYTIENNLYSSEHVLVTYHKNNYMQALDLFPTDKQLHLLDKFTVAFCHIYGPKYLFRMSYSIIDEETREMGFVFYAEDLDEFYMKKFRIIRNENVGGMELVETSSIREAGEQNFEDAKKRWEARYGKKWDAE